MSRGDNFISRRWRGETPLSTLFWRDMLAIGTLLNLLLSFVALMVAALGGDIRLAAALHFAPTPYNLFLCLAVWRSPRRSPAHAMAALVWMGVVTVV